jgi:hypothetical protein
MLYGGLLVGDRLHHLDEAVEVLLCGGAAFHAPYMT